MPGWTLTNSSRRFLTIAVAAALTLLPATGSWAKDVAPAVRWGIWPALYEEGGMVFDGASESIVGVCASTFGTLKAVDLWVHHDPNLRQLTDGFAARTWHGQQYGGILLDTDNWVTRQPQGGWATYRTLGSVHTPSPVRLYIWAAGNLSPGYVPDRNRRQVYRRVRARSVGHDRQVPESDRLRLPGRPRPRQLPL